MTRDYSPSPDTVPLFLKVKSFLIFPPTVRNPTFFCWSRRFSSFCFASRIAFFSATGSLRIWAKLAAVLGVSIGISKSGSCLKLVLGPRVRFLDEERALMAELGRLDLLTAEPYLSCLFGESTESSLESMCMASFRKTWSRVRMSQEKSSELIFATSAISASRRSLPCFPFRRRRDMLPPARI